MPECTSDPREDIGSGVTIERRYLDGKFEGFAYWHTCRDTSGNAVPAEGWVFFDAVRGWSLVQEKPLTVSPSLLCPRCKHHGVISDGRWVPE